METKAYAPRPQAQPAKGFLAVQRTPVRTVASIYGCSEAFAGRVLNGYVPPPQRFKDVVASITGRPAADLFR
jgi:hypothetical protein